MSKKILKLKKFQSEDKERDFWSEVDLAEHFDAKDFVPAHFPNLKPTSSSISIRIPNYLLLRLKERGNKLNIPYQTLLKQYIAEGVERE